MADYYPVIARAVCRLPSKTDQARYAIYERARTALQENLRTHDPPLSPPELATEQFALEAAISRVETEVRRGAREETTFSVQDLSFIVKEFLRWVRKKLNHNISIIRNRLRLGKTTKVVPTKEEITERLAFFVQRTQLNAKHIGRRISSLNWKGTTVLVVLILATLVAMVISGRAKKLVKMQQKSKSNKLPRTNTSGQRKEIAAKPSKNDGPSYPLLKLRLASRR